MVTVLRRLGVTVDFPPGQTCCGMPLFNSGYHDDAARVAARTVRLFERAEHVVVPSGSCAWMVKTEYPGPPQGRPRPARGRRGAGRAHAGAVPVPRRGARRLPGGVGLRGPRHLSRLLSSAARARRVARAAGPAARRRRRRPRRAAGGGRVLRIRWLVLRAPARGLHRHPRQEAGGGGGDGGRLPRRLRRRLSHADARRARPARARACARYISPRCWRADNREPIRFWRRRFPAGPGMP